MGILQPGKPALLLMETHPDARAGDRLCGGPRIVSHSGKEPLGKVLEQGGSHPAGLPGEKTAAQRVLKQAGMMITSFAEDASTLNDP